MLSFVVIAKANGRYAGFHLLLFFSGCLQLTWSATLFGKPPLAVRNGTYAVRGLSFSSDGIFVALTEDGNHSIYVCSTETGKSMYTLKSKYNFNYDPSFCPGRTKIAIGNASDGFTVWDYSTNAIEHIKTPGSVGVTAYSPDGKYLATAIDDRVAIWNANANTFIVLLKLSSTNIFSMVFSPDSKLLATGNESGDVILYEANKWTKVGAIERFKLPVMALAFGPSKSELAISLWMGTFYIMNVESREIKIRQRVGLLISLSCASDYSQFVAAQDDGDLLLWDNADRSFIHTDAKGKMCRTSISHNGKMIAIGYGPFLSSPYVLPLQGKTEIWDIESLVKPKKSD